MAGLGTDIGQAIKLLQLGETVAIPTETVYGLAANALNTKAVAKIFERKKRPHFDPLIVHVATVGDAKKYVKELPELAVCLFEKFSPGPLTIILEKNELIPDLVTAGMNTLAIRIPRHELSLRLLRELDFPLAAPSANPFTYVSPTTAQHVQEQLGDEIPYILDGGPCTVGLESSIIRIKDGKSIELLRPGGISKEELEQFSGISVTRPKLSENASVPGNLKKHYSNRKRLLLTDSPEQFKDKLGRHFLLLRDSLSEIPTENKTILSQNGDLPEAAANLFSALRNLNRPDIQEIIAEKMPETGLGMAMNDRLERASGV